jgi:hypothetical protein
MTRRDITSEIEAAQASESGEEHTLVVKGEEFTLPAGMLPQSVLEQLSIHVSHMDSKNAAEMAQANIGLTHAMRLLFGDEQFRRLEEMRLSSPAFLVVADAATTFYMGNGAGERRGSVESSAAIGEPQKRTSSGTTPSTSAEPASDATGESG